MKDKYTFLHIPKTGGCAVRYAITGMDDRKLSERNNYRKPLTYGKFRFDVHASALSDIPKDEYVVFGIRDPIDKFISSFYYIQKHGAPRGFVRWDRHTKSMYHTFETVNELIEALTSNDDELRTIAEDGIEGTIHLHKESRYERYLISAEYLETRLDSIFHIIWFDDFENSFNELIKKLGIEATLPKDKEIANISKNGTEDKTLSELSKQTLKKMLAVDYEIYDFLKGYKVLGL